MARTIEATDYRSPELDNAIDFSFLATGGTSIQPVNEREFPSTAEGKLEYEQFMRQPVTIRIHKTSNPNDIPSVPVGLNGVQAWLPRDKPIKIPRAFVEVLAQAQVRNYRQERESDPDAAEGMRTRRYGGLEYPFEVIHDPHPKGRAWLNRIVHGGA